MYMQSLAVQFSGNKNVYHYLMVDQVQLPVIKAGTRVVVPGKIKDGKLSLSIATVCEDSNPAIVHDEAVLPLVQIIDPSNLANVTEIVRQQEAKVAA